MGAAQCQCRGGSSSSESEGDADPHRHLSLGPALMDSLSGDIEIQELIEDARAPVFANVYDVGHFAVLHKLNQATQDVLKQGGVFHCAIEVHGKEWSFGGTKRSTSGVFLNAARKCDLHTYRESIYMGDCAKDMGDVRETV